MSLYRFIIGSTTHSDLQATALYQEANLLGLDMVTAIESFDLYLVSGELCLSDQQRLLTELLLDPISQACQADGEVLPPSYSIERTWRVGISDKVADQIQKSAKRLGINGIAQVVTGRRFVIHTRLGLTDSELHHLARRLLANPAIHYYVLGTLDRLHHPVAPSHEKVVHWIPICQLTDSQLKSLSSERRAALDLAEMQAIQAYYRSQQREPSDIEFETIAQTWSEHCSHKTFRATIDYKGQTIKGLLDTYIRAATETIQAPWVISAFIDNAGIIAFDDEYQLAFKVETHNRPSAIEPFSGANTGLGGVIRDVLGVSARPIAATDVFALGPQTLEAERLPEGSLHPRLIYAGVVEGIEDYGNKTGIPTVNGAFFYDPAYTANPLVFCGCVGLLPKDRHPRQPQVGDRVQVLGSRTGREGLRGATFSSMAMDAQSSEVTGASLPTGDPIIAKGLIEVLDQARDRQLYHAITDCGAGGLSSAIGEMASDIGVEVELSHVPLKYPGLSAWELWLSETQERMVLAVPPQHVGLLQTLCAHYGIESADLGMFTGHRQLVVRYQHKIVLQLDNRFLYEGRPPRYFSIGPIEPASPPISVTDNGLCQDSQELFEGYLQQLLSHPNIASKEAVIRRYDHEVQGGTVIKPLVGTQNDGPSDACVLKPQGTRGLRGIVLSNGFNPELGKYDPYRMAVSVVDEAVRNAVSVGADPDRIALLDNFCWGDPNRPETLAALVECARGCYTAALHYATPFISGKDSLNNEYLDPAGQRQAIPGTLLISALGIIDDVRTAISLDFKTPGNAIYLLGETKAHFGGSHFNLIWPQVVVATEPPDLPQAAPLLYRCLHQAIQRGLVRACHDLSEGGLAVALAEMCIAGRLGCEIMLNTDDPITYLFSESNGRLLLEIEAHRQDDFEALLLSKNLKQWLRPLGFVSHQPKLWLRNRQHTLIALSVDQLVGVWQRPAS